jgi:hypothetical protein
MSKGSFYSRIRLTFLKLMESVGTTASNMASNAKLRANEINLENRRREILTNFSLRAFELWQKGVPLPDSLSEMLSELSEIEDRLSVLRAQKYAKVPSEPAPAAEDEEYSYPPVSCTVGDAEGDEAAQAVPCDLEDAPPAPDEPADAPAAEGAAEGAAQEPAAEASPAEGPVPADKDAEDEPDGKPQA